MNRRVILLTISSMAILAGMTSCRTPSSQEPFEYISRKEWAPIEKSFPSNANRMETVSRITVHHDGIEQSAELKTYDQVKKRLLAVRQYHLSRGWADIGYHFIIDSSGRVWQGRPVSLQGAHVSGDNDENIGILVLGNFQHQHPTDEALSILSRLVRDLKLRYQIRDDRVYTHRELSRRTECPGDHLQAVIDTVR